MASVRERLNAHGITVIGRRDENDDPFYRDINFDHPIKLHVRVFGHGQRDTKLSINLSDCRMLYPDAIQWQSFMARCLDLGINDGNLLLLVKEEIINQATRICPAGTWELPVVPTFNVLVNRAYLDLAAAAMEEEEPFEEEHMEEDGEDAAASRQVPAAEWSIQDLERVVFSSDVGMCGEQQCTICLEAFGGGMEVTRMPCSHLYHGDCIVGWLHKSNACPLCRFQMPTDDA